MISWEQYEAAYNAAYTRAQQEKLCFCACGCGLPVDQLSIVGGPVLCTACRKAGRKSHFLTRRPVETYDWDAWERANPTPEYTEAEDFVRSVADVSGPRLRAMGEKLARGERLTDIDVEQALRSKAADQRADAAAVERVIRSGTRLHRRGAIDLDRVFIPDTVAEGDYAVIDESGEPVRITISRPVDGLVAGFTVVTFTIGQAEPQYGLQRPQPWREVEGYRHWYIGPMAHLVDTLASNPGKARERWEAMA